MGRVSWAEAVLRGYADAATAIVGSVDASAVDPQTAQSVELGRRCAGLLLVNDDSEQTLYVSVDGGQSYWPMYGDDPALWLPVCVSAVRIYSASEAAYRMLVLHGGGDE